MKRHIRVYAFFIAIALFPYLWGCQTIGAPANADLNQYSVKLHLKDYTPQLKPERYEFYRDKKICMSNIRNEAQNTTHFFYFSKDNQVRYELSNKGNSPMQLVSSFLWYAYQKAFESAGIETVHRCEAGMPEFWIVIGSLDDEEVRFKTHIFNNAEAIYEKELDVIMKSVRDRHPSALNARAYEMIDLSVIAMLDDPGIKEILLRVE